MHLVGYTWKYVCDARTHERQIYDTVVRNYFNENKYEVFLNDSLSTVIEIENLLSFSNTFSIKAFDRYTTTRVIITSAPNELINLMEVLFLFDIRNGVFYVYVYGSVHHIIFYE